MKVIQILLAAWVMVAAGFASAQTKAPALPNPLPATMGGTGAQNPAAAASLMGLQPAAPLRTKLSFAPFGTQASATVPLYSTQTSTGLFVPIQAARAYAIRVAVAAQFADGLNIVDAAVYPTDSYSGIAFDPSFQGTGGFGADRTSAFPTANSVYQTGTLTNGSNQITGLVTGLLPSVATMYVLGPSGTPLNGTATVTNGTTVTMSANFTGTTGSYNIQFTNLATECPLYFDGQGAGSDTINTSGSKRSLQIWGNPNSPGTGQQQFTLQWSDFVHCDTVPRADGGTQPLLAIYLTLGTGRYGRATVDQRNYNTKVAPNFSNRFIYPMISWNANVDLTDAPATVGWKSDNGNNPIMGISYMTDTPGLQIATNGDSIVTAPPSHGMASFIAQACWRLSKPKLPCELFSLAWGGATSSIYDEVLRNNIAFIDPSVIFMQGIARGDGLNISALNTLMAKAQSYTRKTGARLAFYGDVPFTVNADNSIQAQTDIATMRARLVALGTSCQPDSGGVSCPRIPVFDLASKVSREVLGGLSWDYLALGFTTNAASATGQGGNVAVSYSGGNLSCYAGDVVTDLTTPSAITSGTTAISATTTTVTIPGSAIGGAGIGNGDSMMCAAPGYAALPAPYSNLPLTDDNTHPNDNAAAVLATTADTVLKQAAGFQ